MTRAEERKMYLSIGICPICHKHSVEPNKRACLECLGREQDRYMKLRAAGKYNQATDTRRKRIVAEERRKNGLCYRCGKHEVSGGGLCGMCKAKARRYRERKRKNIGRSERPYYGRCYICGKEELYENHKVCKDCYEKRLQSLPAMWANMDNSYFKEQNDLDYAIRKLKKQEREKHVVQELENKDTDLIMRSVATLI